MTPSQAPGGIRLGGAVLSRIARTRGNGCEPLAELLGDAPVIAIRGDVQRSCIEHRIDLLVTRRLTSFDLVPVAVPHSLDLARVSAVTAAVAGGPHSEMAAAVTARIAAVLDVPGSLATVYHDAESHAQVLDRFDELVGLHPTLESKAVEAPNATALIDTFTPTTLLVLGAPGGSWFQRQFFGPGHHMQVAAPCGAVVLRSAPRRCYHIAVDPAGTAVGPHLAAEDALQVIGARATPVAEEGRLVGILRTATLRDAPPRATVADLMEPAVAVKASEPLAEVAELHSFLGGAPVPVIDDTGRLVGIVPSPAH